MHSSCLLNKVEVYPIIINYKNNITNFNLKFNQVVIPKLN